MDRSLISWILIIGGIVLLAWAAIASVASGFTIDSWVLPFGALSAAVGLTLRVLP